MRLFLEQARDGEQAPRQGRDCTLQGPRTAIDEDEVNVAFPALATLTIAVRGQPSVLRLLGATGDQLKAPTATWR